MGSIGLGTSRRRTGRARRAPGPLDRPVAVGVAVTVLAGAVAVLRIVVAGHGHIDTFIVAGNHYVDAHRVPSGVPVGVGNGYDGQFYYRIALAPFDFSRTAYGIRIDSVERFGRITYPLLAWLVAGTRDAAVPWTLVVVNIAGLGALGMLGAVVARDGGRRVWWGLLLPASFGFLWTLSRDLTEITESVFLVGGFVALRRGRPVLAGIVFSAAVLGRETAMVAVACVAATQAVRWWRQRSRVGVTPAAVALGDGGRSASAATGVATASGISVTPRETVAWVIPVAVFAAWQAVVWAGVGHVAVTGSGERNTAFPLQGFVDGFSHYVHEVSHTSGLLWFGELVVLVIVVATAALAWRVSAAPAPERLAWIAYVVLALCLAPGIWLGDVGFRSLDDVYVMSCLVVLSSPRTPKVMAVAVAGSWLVVAVELIKFI